MTCRRCHNHPAYGRKPICKTCLTAIWRRTKSCSVEGCHGTYKGRGFCERHYVDPEAPPQPAPNGTCEECGGRDHEDCFVHFMSLIGYGDDDECWIFPRHRCSNRGSVGTYASRNLLDYAFDFWAEPWDRLKSGEFATHLEIGGVCNPLCVNFRHLMKY